jgi:hypothetical protein
MIPRPYRWLVGMVATALVVLVAHITTAWLVFLIGGIWGACGAMFVNDRWWK